MTVKNILLNNFFLKYDVLAINSFVKEWNQPGIYTPGIRYEDSWSLLFYYHEIIFYFVAYYQKREAKILSLKEFCEMCSSIRSTHKTFNWAGSILSFSIPRFSKASNWLFLLIQDGRAWDQQYNNENLTRGYGSHFNLLIWQQQTCRSKNIKYHTSGDWWQ